MATPLAKELKKTRPAFDSIRAGSHAVDLRTVNLWEIRIASVMREHGLTSPSTRASELLRGFDTVNRAMPGGRRSA